MTYDSAADAAYLYFTDEALSPGHNTTACRCPDGVQAMVNLDWKEGKLAGLEVLDAKSLLFEDLRGTRWWGSNFRSADPARGILRCNRELLNEGSNLHQQHSR